MESRLDQRLSYSEERFWRGEQPQPDTSTFVECPRHLPLIARIGGPLDAQRLYDTLVAVVARHEVLRSRFVERRGTPRRVIADLQSNWLTVTDFGAGSDIGSAPSLVDLLHEDVNRRFDLAEAPLIRARLIKVANDHVLVFVMHHIVCDGWSKLVLAREIGLCYEADACTECLPPLNSGYGDYVRRQRAAARSPHRSEQLRYWAARLAGMTPLVVPGDRARAPDGSTSSRTHRFSIAAERAEGLRALARAHRLTPGVTAAAVLKVLLWRLTGVDDVAIGMPFAERNRSEFDGVVGLFLNLLILRTDLSGNPAFVEVLQRVKQTFVEAYDRSDTPYSQLLQSLGRDAARVSVVFNFITVRRASGLRMAGLDVDPIDVDVDSPSCADLSIHLFDRASELSGFVLYKKDRFSPQYIARLSAGFDALLGAAIDSPSCRIADLGRATPEALATAV